MSEWQPIETAPKDGEAITVYCGDIMKMAFVYWHDDMNEWTVQGTFNTFQDAHYMTHWRPSLKPPKGFS